MKKLFLLVFVLSFFVIIPSALAGVLPCPNTGDCCTSNGTPGCDDCTCQTTVCGFDPFCCDINWDSTCADEAGAFCSICPAPHDECSNAIPIFNGTTPFSNVGATTDATFCGTGQADIWYVYAATCTGDVVYNTCTSILDTVLAVYDGTNCADAIAETSELACNDDTTACGGFTFQSQVIVPVVQHQQYLVRVGGWLGEMNEGVINITPEANCQESCRAAQLATQDAVDEESSYKNHGQYVKAAAKAANPFLKDGLISKECHSCIVNQFARSIPEGQQEECGCEVCGGDACLDQTDCGPVESGCSNVCPAGPAAGECFCHQGSPCDALTPCTTNADCPEGWSCAHSCCEGTLCLPPCGVFVGEPDAIEAAGTGQMSTPPK